MLWPPAGRRDGAVGSHKGSCGGSCDGAAHEQRPGRRQQAPGCRNVFRRRRFANKAARARRTYVPIEETEEPLEARRACWRVLLRRVRAVRGAIGNGVAIIGETKRHLHVTCIDGSDDPAVQATEHGQGGGLADNLRGRGEELGVRDPCAVPEGLHGVEEPVKTGGRVLAARLPEVAHLDHALIAEVQAEESVTKRRELLKRQVLRRHLEQNPPCLWGDGVRLKGLQHPRVQSGDVHVVTQHPQQPRVEHRLLRVHPLLRVHRHEPLHEVDAIGGDAGPSVRLSPIDGALPHTLELLLAVRKRSSAGEKHEDNDPQAPHVALRCVALSQNLGRNICQRPATNVHLDIGVPHLAEAEVDQLQVTAPLAVVQEVLQL
mmetsp:Transcript_24727/g.70933  ORF Transcript_24727/g.70933 Transcript_24727/m.70933 type:complete len:375 (+) Transcript_24727:59-1183(+)